jgi:hypothetical protein
MVADEVSRAMQSTGWGTGHFYLYFHVTCLAAAKQEDGAPRSMLEQLSAGRFQGSVTL